LKRAEETEEPVSIRDGHGQSSMAAAKTSLPAAAAFLKARERVLDIGTFGSLPKFAFSGGRDFF